MSAIYTFSFGPHDPHKNKFLTKIEGFEMAISQKMAYSENGHIEAESTLCGLQPHEKINVGPA